MAALQSVAVNHEALVVNLDRIRNKNIGDNFWFELDAEGDFELRPRPAPATDWLSRIWLCVSKIFEAIVCWMTGEPSALEQKFIWISDQVEAYLEELCLNRNERELGNFLNSYTTAMSELYRCAARMVTTEKISQNTLDHLRGKARIQDYMVMEIDENGRVNIDGREYHPYRQNGQLWVMNVREKTHAKFHCSEPIFSAGLQNLSLSPDKGSVKEKTIAFSQSVRGTRIRAEVNYRVTLGRVDKFAYDFLISSNVDFSHTHKKLNMHQQRRIMFENQNDKPVSINIRDVAPERGQLELVPQTKKDFPFPGTYTHENVSFSVTYLTAEQTVGFNCKLARYRARINESGELTLRVIPMHITAALPAVEVVVDPRNPLVMGDQQRNLLAKFGVVGNPRRFEQWIPKAKPLTITYQELCEQMGLRHDAQQNLRVLLESGEIRPVILNPA